MLRRFIKQTKVNFADRSPSKCNVVKYLKLEQNATKFPSTIFNFRYLKTSYESLPFTKKKRNVEIRNYAALLR